MRTIIVIGLLCLNFNALASIQGQEDVGQGSANVESDIYPKCLLESFVGAHNLGNQVFAEVKDSVEHKEYEAKSKFFDANIVVYPDRTATILVENNETKETYLAGSFVFNKKHPPFWGKVEKKGIGFNVRCLEEMN